MQTYSIQELENAVKETGYKYIALYTSDGKQLIPYNNTKPTVPERVEEIKKSTHIMDTAHKNST